MVCNDPQIAAYIKSNFIPVANDDVEYHHSSEDDKLSVRWMKRVFDQHSVGHKQGIYAVTSSGKLLFFFAGYYPEPEEILSELKNAVAEYRSMTKAERVIADRPATSDGLAMVHRPDVPFVDIRVTKRSLPNDAIPMSDVRHENYFHFSYLWLKPSEVARLVPEAPKQGDRQAWPADIVERFVTNHLLVLEARVWWGKHIERAEVASIVDSVDGDLVRLRLEGRFLMQASNFEYNEGKYEGRLLGKATFSREKGTFVDFEAVALGEDVVVTGLVGHERGPPENVVGAVFEFNQTIANALAFPSDYPKGYETW